MRMEDLKLRSSINVLSEVIIQYILVIRGNVDKNYKRLTTQRRYQDIM